MRDIVIRVLDHRGQSMDDPPKATFGRGGGKIGRGEDTDLVLFDSERVISRVHAEVVWRDNGFYLVARGSNPMQVSGAPLSQGEDTPLHVGDEIVIGPYRMRVDNVADAAYVAAGAAPPPSAGDPLGLGFGSGIASTAPPASDPLGMDLFGTPIASPPPAHFARPAAVPAAPAQAPIARLPDDFDPFADLLGARPPATPPSARPKSDVLPGGAEPRIDDLFGLGPSAGTDPLRSSPLFEQASAGHTGAGDPFALFGGAAAPASPAAAVPDHVHDIHSPFAAPSVRFDAAPGAASPARPPAEFDSTRMHSTPAEAQSLRSQSEPVTADAATDRPARTTAASEAGTVPVAAAAPADQLLAAFLAGLGTRDLELPDGLTPELMQRVGVLLRESLGGTLDLLRARQSIKQEMRADMTMMSARGNNPLKFSPDVGVAVAQMLNPRMRGFLAPEAAVREAFEDLRGHEMGMMAGVRAALERLLMRFDPASLEARIESRSLLGNLMAGSRKAQLWEAYTSLYRDISRESQEDFQTVLGRAFVDAYKAQSQRGTGSSANESER